MLRWVLAAALFLTPGTGWAAGKSTSFGVTLTVRATCNAELRAGTSSALAGDMDVQCDSAVPFRLERETGPDLSHLQDAAAPMPQSGAPAKTRSGNIIWVVF